MPTYKMCLLKRGITTTDEEIFQTVVKAYMFDYFKEPMYYGFRVFGANWKYCEKYTPGESVGFIAKFDYDANRFNPNKLAYDPYSKELSHLPSEINPHYNIFRSGAEFYLIDNAKWAPKSVFYPIELSPVSKAPLRAFTDEVIGEVHIKDLTYMLDMEEKGTFKGAAKFAKNLSQTGITMVEFLPLNEFDSKQIGSNYWGYMPLGYFTLCRRYAYDKRYGKILNEFREMVDEFHKNGIKVCLDMVYNHTGETGLVNNNPQDDIQLSYSLIDNASYYKTYNEGYYRNNSGCGNDLNMNCSAVVDLIVDSLEFWVNQGVDAFRFDLAAALLDVGEDCNEKYDTESSLANKLKEKLKERSINIVDDFEKAQDGIILIAEPWMCMGHNCYQLGNFPEFWAEWNDISRDTIRKLTLRAHEITPRMIKDVFEGTTSRFKTNKSINYIACHDGFSLYDLNSYKKKNPQTNGGSNWEISGDYDNNKIARENAIRAQIAFLFLSRGIPMTQIGDMIMHTKGGNNNSYNKDDRTNYLNWNKALAAGSFEARIFDYFRNIIEFRKENKIFSSKEFLNSVSYHYNNGEIAQYNNFGYWDNNKDNFFGALINSEKRIYMALSKGNDIIHITLPKNNENKGWHKCMDTFDFDCIEFSPKEWINGNYDLNPHAIAIFMEQ